MKTLPKDQEQRIIKAAEAVVDLVSQGSHPNDAMFKIAIDYDLTPEYVKRLTEVFNTSRMLAHFQTAPPEKRADEFPLASAAAVMGRMYPEKVEAAGVKAASAHCHSTWFDAPPNFTTPPELEKAALAPAELLPTHGQPDLDLLLKRARNHEDALRSQIDVARTDDEYHREMARCAIVKAAEYFRSLDHVPFEAVDSNVLTTHGAVAKPLMDAVFLACRGERFGEKRGQAYDTQRVFPQDVEPYKSLNDAVTWADRWRKSAGETEALREELNSFRSGLDTRMKKLAELRGTERSIPFPFEGISKSAIGLGPVASATVIGRAAAEMFGDNEDDPRKFEMDVQRSIDPDQETALQAPRVKAILNEFMSTDPVISGYPPDQVLTAFNEISQMTPRVSQQPALLRGMLARRLEMGRTEPFEASQAIDAETGLKRIEGPGIPVK
jgi:hypothetical protein